ncbi:MAG: hypothetical protein RJA49_2938 [Actinomycetota bacterium]
MFQQRTQRRRSAPTLVVGLVVGALVAVAIGVGLQFGNPFGTHTVDHSAPPVLVDLRTLADYHGAQGQFEVTVDQEKDVKFLPSAIAGERVQFVAVANVDAVVDFAHLADGAVQIGNDGKDITVTLPPATLAAPEFDRTLSHVMNRDRGIVNRVGGVFSDNPTSEQGLYEAAAEKIATAAEATTLRTKAEGNTRAMLETMFRGLGYEHVVVRFTHGVA